MSIPPANVLRRIRLFGFDWVLTTLGLYDATDPAVADTIPAPPPTFDADPDSAPPVPAPPEGEDEWISF